MAKEKILILWSDNDLSFFTKKISNYDPNPKLIQSKDDFNLFKFKSVYTQIFINVDLYWTDEAKDGYTFFLKLLDKINQSDQVAQNIQFVTLSNSREEIFDSTDGINRFIAKSFPHIEISDNFSVDLIHNSYSKWNYLRNYAIVESPILDLMLHHIDRCLKSKKKLTASVSEEFINKFKGLGVLGGPEIQKFVLSDYADLSPKEIIKKLYKLLVDRMRTLNPGKHDIDKTHRVLFVEDNDEDYDAILQVLKKFFTYIEPFKNGSDAKNELQQKGHDYDLVFTDMELLEDNKKIDQPDLGVDIVDHITRFLPHITLRIFTRLPKQTANAIIQRPPNEILYKPAYFGIDNILSDEFPLIQKEMRRKAKYKNPFGPEAGWWVNEHILLKNIFINLKTVYPEFYNGIWKYVFTRVESIIDKLKSDSIFNPDEMIAVEMPSPKTEKPEYFLDIDKANKISANKICDILIHRLLFLYESKNSEYPYGENSGKKKNIGEVEFSNFSNLGCFQEPITIEGRDINSEPWEERIKFYKKYMYFLGVNADYKMIRNSNKSIILVKDKNLFAEETEWLQATFNLTFKDLLPELFTCLKDMTDDVYYLDNLKELNTIDVWTMSEFKEFCEKAKNKVDEFYEGIADEIKNENETFYNSKGFVEYLIDNDQDAISDIFDEIIFV